MLEYVTQDAKVSACRSYSLGYNGYFLRLEEETLYGGGANTHGQMGDGTVTYRSHYVPMMDGVQTLSDSRLSTLVLAERHCASEW